MENTEKKFVLPEADKVLNILRSGEHDYYSLTSLSGSTGIAPDVLKPSLQGDDRIRLSVIKDSDGNPLYTLNSRVGLVKDVWNAIRYINYLKTE